MFEMNQGLLKALEKINAFDLATRKYSGPPKTAIEAIIEATEIAKLATTPAGSLELITKASSSIPLIAEAISNAKSKQDLINESIFGFGNTVANYAKIAAIDSAAMEASKAFGSWDDVYNQVTNNARAYNEQLAVTKSISTILQGRSYLDSVINASIFENQFAKETPRIFDVLSANTFSNVIKVHESIKATASLEEELALLNITLEQDEEVKNEVSSFANSISEAEESYEKIDEIATNFVHKLTSKFGLSKQYAYYIAAIIIFVLCVWGKDLLSLKKDKAPNVTNTYVIKNKINASRSKDSDVILRNAPIYQTYRTSTRKIGTFKERTIVEIQKVKKGWCYVKGEAELIHKSNGIKLTKDSIINGWVQQRYLNNFKD